jgi:hypothetical protein
MKAVILLFSLTLAASQDGSLDRFSFCRESGAGQYSSQCFELDGDGKGVFKFTFQDADTVEVPFEFSARGVERFYELLQKTDYLMEGDRYESGRRVANLGTKIVVVEGAWGRRDAVFNYSTMDEAAELSTFFERLINQEMLLFDLDLALQFDRLGVPERLERIEQEIRSGRLPDPARVIPVLEKIEAAPGLVNYAKTTATRLKEEIIEDAN